MASKNTCFPPGGCFDWVGHLQSASSRARFHSFILAPLKSSLPPLARLVYSSRPHATHERRNLIYVRMARVAAPRDRASQPAIYNQPGIVYTYYSEKESWSAENALEPILRIRTVEMSMSAPSEFIVFEMRVASASGEYINKMLSPIFLPSL